MASTTSARGKRMVDTQEDSCGAAYWRRARTIADLPTVQPMASVASRLRRWRNSSASRVSVWVQMTVGGF